ncbi:hypothetical protein [Luteibacter sp. 9133]|uniref:hypothetical protein n=1 Tax=Luteibacter sp. 9133 TaxID=1500891 RepID=UPI0018CF0B12|nr:hypothetical protein [Luteibacter sp. 9133]
MATLDPWYRNFLWRRGDLRRSLVLERVPGRPFKQNVWTVPCLPDELKKDPTHHIKKYPAVFAQGRGVSWPKAGTFNAEHAIPVTTAEAWARRQPSG